MRLSITTGAASARLACRRAARWRRTRGYESVTPQAAPTTEDDDYQEALLEIDRRERSGRAVQKHFF